jgi:hypothetical protein
MENEVQPLRAVFGRGCLFRTNEPPIAVRYDVVLVALPVAITTVASPGEVQWQWSKAEGFITLVDNSDVGLIDVNVEYTLELADGRRCRALLGHDRNMSMTRFIITCSPADSVQIA